ncbi:GNAT family N-acetyltransferase [Actinotignum sp. GS-2025b]|uniref:GNAT family N-acetyltransferase n=1 Tax=unclassified Actinotignum TaxID=2632702 RepID=UPI003F45E3CA
MAMNVDIVLRPVREGDAAAIAAAFASHPDMIRQGNITDLAAARRYIARILEAPDSQLAWVIARDDSDELIGMVRIDADWDEKNGWFSYWLHHDYWGRGVMSRAAAAVADWALRERGLERLELGHRVNNPASGGVARAAGFLKEGTERGKFLINGQRIDVDLYGRLANDPLPHYRPVPFRG